MTRGAEDVVFEYCYRCHTRIDLYGHDPDEEEP